MKGSAGIRFAGTSLPLIPNVRKFEIVLGKLDALLQKFGIDVRIGNFYGLWPMGNHKQNRYLKHQYRRLIRANGGIIVKRVVEIPRLFISKKKLHAVARKFGISVQELNRRLSLPVRSLKVV